MTDIPRSVMEEARTVWNDLLEHGYFVHAIPASPAAAIARALLARDKRAAGIARAAGNTWSGTRDVERACQEAVVDSKCEEIAEAILTYDTPTGQEDTK